MRRLHCELKRNDLLSIADMFIQGRFHSIERLLKQRPLAAEIETHKPGAVKFDAVLEPYAGVFKKLDGIRQISGSHVDPGQIGCFKRGH